MPASGTKAVLWAFLSLCLALMPGHGFGAESVLAQFLAELQPAEVFPDADRLGPAEGSPPVASAFRGEDLIGYVFLNSDFVNATGYSGKPIHVLIGMDRDGVIRSAKIVKHHEPIVLIGIPESRINAVVDGYLGLDAVAVAREGSSNHRVDVVSGATVTVMVIDDSILRSAIKVARGLGLGDLQKPADAPTGPTATIDMTQNSIEDWIALVGNGSVSRLKLTKQDINEAFEKSGDPKAAKRPERGPATDTFIELYAAQVSVPSIGRSLLGDGEYQNLTKKLEPDQQAILLTGRGEYSFKGSSYVRGGIFDRFQIIQGDLSVRFHDYEHKRLRKVDAEGAPDFKEVDLFRIPSGSGFDGTKPWRLELLVGRATGATSKVFSTFDLDYQIPDQYLNIEQPPAPPVPAADAATPAVTEEQGPPLWQKLWRTKQVEVVILLLALGVLTVIFYFQDSLVNHRLLTERVRIAFLIFTLFGIGWYANAQLSVVNILTVFNALVSGFNWEYFLMEPLIFILWGSVAASLIFWGRGAYCGWLCPFGALQELLNRLAKAVKIPQWTVPWGLHERLWTLKYLVFLVLFGVSLHSLVWAERLAEVEPFKTAVILKFAREWPFVVFAGATLAIGLFVERFYCRYICPLGAALAIPARLRTFNWLKRYKQCGTPCQLCGNGCMVQAIHPEGDINPNECLYCLHCQQLYYDDHICPVMVQKRHRRERLAARTGKSDPAQVEELLTAIRAGSQRR